MASTINQLGLILTFLLVAPPLSLMARPLDQPTPKLSLEARLKWEDQGSSRCWDSLLELQACSGEVILFFLNGETYLGPACCHAIRTIQHQCWPSMLGSLGFTSDEGYILEGYCDATAANSSPPPPEKLSQFIGSLNGTT